MLLLLSLMLQDPPEVVPVPAGQEPEPTEVVPIPAAVEGHSHGLGDLRAGIGGWIIGEFRARTPLGLRVVEDDLLAEAHLEIGFDWEGWGVYLGGAAAGTGDVQARIGWLRMSTPALLETSAPLPIALRVSGGVTAGSLDIDESGFGDFEPAVGLLGRISFETPRDNPLALAIWADVRAMEFDYDEPTISGDDSLGGVGFALGLSAGFRF